MHEGVKRERKSGGESLVRKNNVILKINPGKFFCEKKFAKNSGKIFLSGKLQKIQEIISPGIILENKSRKIVFEKIQKSTKIFL